MTSFFDFLNEQSAARKAARRPAARRADSPTSSTPAAPGSSAPPEALSVSQLTSQIERVLKTHLPASVLVQGEVSNFKHHSGSGHLYFTLKDPDACINCVMFRNDAMRLKFEPSDGMELLAAGRIGIYAQRGSYQLYVSRLEPLGQGALELAFRQLCEKLQNEGLFEADRKKPLPEYPMRLALVTSRQTAALQDMLKVLRRFPWVRLMLYHVPVQGEGAADLIAQAIRDLSAHALDLGGIDAILLARGGGSLEDLWQFNEEVVARAIVASRVPVITGIGHEVDVSIADLVADYHAHTPTEAAQVAMSRWRSADEDLAARAGRLRSALRSSVQEARSSFAAIERHEFFRKPTERVQELRQRVDDLQEDIANALRDRLTEASHRLNTQTLRLAECSPRHLLARKQQVLATAESRLLQHHPAQLIRLRRQELSANQSRLQLALRHTLSQTQSTLDLLERHLNAVGPQQVLARGYSITTLKKGGAILRSKAQVHGGQRLITHLADGQVESVAEDPNQPTLFD